VGGAVLFDKDDEGYQAWLISHPDGYVLNSYRKLSPKYLVLHRTGCHTISDYRQHAGKPAFTGGQYIKICGLHPGDLLAWLRAAGHKTFSGYCTSCRTSEQLLDEAALAQHQFERDVRRYLDNPQALATDLPAAPSKPTKTLVTTQVFVRNAAVAAAVLNRAAGICEGCGKAAPFLRKSDGSPYLEVHHKVPLAADGDDSTENAIALCPNCHRAWHFG
jgi:5-methylcytosine-specific restriction endonuclease McrA